MSGLLRAACRAACHMTSLARALPPGESMRITTAFTLSSEPTYFYTESFRSSSPNLNVNGDSEAWVNKIDVDVPLGVELFGHELRTGLFQPD